MTDSLDRALASPRMTRDDLSIALERAGAAYGAYELSARRTRTIWRTFKYGGPMVFIVIGLLLWVHTQDQHRNDVLSSKLTAGTVIQDSLVSSNNRLVAQMQTLQPAQIVVALPVPEPIAPSAATVPPPASAENGESPPPAPADAVPPTPTPVVSTPAVAPSPAVTQTLSPAPSTAGCILNLLCLQNLLAGS